MRFCDSQLRPNRGQGSKDLALVYAEQAPPGLLPGLFNSHPHCVLKHLLHTTVAQGGALQIAFGLDFMSNSSPFCWWDTGAAVRAHLPQVSLGGHDQHRHPGQVFSNFSNPLVMDTSQRVTVGHREADEDNVGVLVRSRSDLSEVVMTRRVPQPQVDLNSVHVHLHPCVVKHCGLVTVWESFWREADQQGRLPNCTVPNQDTLHWHLRKAVHGCHLNMSLL